MVGTFTVAAKELRDQFGSKRFLILFGLVLLRARKSVEEIFHDGKFGEPMKL